MHRLRTGLPVLVAATALLLGWVSAPAALAGEHDDHHRIKVTNEGTVKIVTVDEDGNRQERTIEIDSGKPRPFLGVVLQRADDGGAEVTKVVEDSAAERAGLQVGDVLVGIDGESVDGPWDVTEKILASQPGDRVDLEIMREGSRDSLSAELGEREGMLFLGNLGLHDLHMNLEELDLNLEELQERLQDMDLDIHVPDMGHHKWRARAHRPKLGVQLVQPTAELREHLGGDPDAGVLVSKVLEEMPAEFGGVEVGDLIIAADGEPIRSSGDLVRALRDKNGEKMELELIRDGRRIAVDVFIPQREEELDDPANNA
jgi:S1-C subfamily serine protease